MLTPDQLNYLVYRYLLEAGYLHAAFSMIAETGMPNPGVSPEEVPVGSLVGLVQRGLQFADIELHTDASGQLHICDQEFDLFTPHTCINAERLVLDTEAGDGRRTLARAPGIAPDQHVRSGIDLSASHLGGPMDGEGAAFGEEGGHIGQEGDQDESSEEFGDQELLGVSTLDRAYVRALAGLFGRFGGEGEHATSDAPRVEPLDTREEAYLASKGPDAKRKPISRYYVDIRTLVAGLRAHAEAWAASAVTGKALSKAGQNGKKFHAGRKAFSFCRRTRLGLLLCEFGRVFVLRLADYPRELEVTEIHVPAAKTAKDSGTGSSPASGSSAPKRQEPAPGPRPHRIYAAAWSDKKEELALLLRNGRLLVLSISLPSVEKAEPGQAEHVEHQGHPENTGHAGHAGHTGHTASSHSSHSAHQPEPPRLRVTLQYNGYPFGLVQGGKLLYSPFGDYLLYYGTSPRPYVFYPGFGRLIDEFSPLQSASTTSLEAQNPCSAMLNPGPVAQYTAMSFPISDPVLYFDVALQVPSRKEVRYQFPCPGADFYLSSGRPERTDRFLPQERPFQERPLGQINYGAPAPFLAPLYKEEEGPSDRFGISRFSLPGRRPVATDCAWLSGGEYVYVRTDGCLVIERVPVISLERVSPFRALASNSPLASVLFQAKLSADPLVGVEAVLLRGLPAVSPEGAQGPGSKPYPAIQIYAYTAQGQAYSLQILGPVCEGGRDGGQRWRNVKLASFQVCRGSITASALRHSIADSRTDLLLGDEFGYVHCLGSEMKYLRWNIHAFNHPVTSLEVSGKNILCGCRGGFSRVITPDGVALPLYLSGSGAIVASLTERLAKDKTDDRLTLWCTLSRDGILSMSSLADIFPQPET